MCMSYLGTRSFFLFFAHPSPPAFCLQPPPSPLHPHLPSSSSSPASSTFRNPSDLRRRRRRRRRWWCVGGVERSRPPIATTLCPPISMNTWAADRACARAPERAKQNTYVSTPFPPAAAVLGDLLYRDGNWLTSDCRRRDDETRASGSLGKGQRERERERERDRERERERERESGDILPTLFPSGTPRPVPRCKRYSSSAAVAMALAAVVGVVNSK
ncbi:hypothetical protein LZ31DRAFT_216215 [Colletotrichum somersetense]|nr:hypothetical protein LZ31DRAFT_216215 [Colletotrichum somersetense]